MPPEAGQQGASKYRAAIAGSKPPAAHATSQRGRDAAPPVTGTAPAAHAPAPSSQAAAAAGNATAARAAAGHAAAPDAAEVTLGAPEVERFRRRVWAHDRRHYRSLPWRETSDPYAILVSEVMLQQTQVTRVGNYYGRFLARFPDPDSLAAAPLGAVLELWSGLGYNRRALALQRAAGAVVREHGGVIPADRDALLRLPGVGPATAGALLAFAFARPAVFIETNIRRVFLHQYFPAATTVPDAALLPLVARTLDRRQPRRWYYALMDWGAALGQQRAGNPNRRSAPLQPAEPVRGVAPRVARARPAPARRTALPDLRRAAGSVRRRSARRGGGRTGRRAVPDARWRSGLHRRVYGTTRGTRFHCVGRVGRVDVPMIQVIRLIPCRALRRGARARAVPCVRGGLGAAAGNF